MVAHLVRTGDFAMTWELKPEAREANYAEVMLTQTGDENGAFKNDPEDDNAGGSDNDDMQFENV